MRRHYRIKISGSGWVDISRGAVDRTSISSFLSIPTPHLYIAERGIIGVIKEPYVERLK
jgi:hypothetical protein